MSTISKSDQIGLVVTLTGIAMVAVGVGADALGLDLTPGVGLVQILGILVGITAITAAGYFFLGRRQPPGVAVSLMADVGIRLGLTGLLTCYVSGLADMLGVGTHRGVRFERPYLGPLQLAGFGFGLLIVVAGLVLYWLGGRRETSDTTGSDR